MSTISHSSEEEYFVIEDKPKLGFLDFEKEQSRCNYIPDQNDSVAISFPFKPVSGMPKHAFVGENVADVITIENKTEGPVQLWGFHIYASNPQDSFTLSLMEPPLSANSNACGSRDDFLESFALEDRVLHPLETLRVWLSCKAKEIGMYSSVVNFDVGEERIERVAFVLVEDHISYSLKTTFREHKLVLDTYVAGSCSPQWKGNEGHKNYGLPRYDIPRTLSALIESDQIPEVVERGLERESYASYFKTLLMMEAIQLEKNMRSYNMKCTTLRRENDQLLSMEVPGLSERKPSLIRGDFIFAKRAAKHGKNSASAIYEGFVHHVECDEVYLKFHPEFHSCHKDRNLYEVRFCYNRTTMKRFYLAVDEAAENLSPEFLFPSLSRRRRHIQTIPLVPISAGSFNNEQICSIQKILVCKGGPPYVIRGPPGTGKTKTIVEAVLQLYKTHKNGRFLVCAPSNRCADDILERILAQQAIRFLRYEIFRLNESTRPYVDVKHKLLPFCFFDNFIFQCPSVQILQYYRIIVSTYTSASCLYWQGVVKDHFSHILLDEANQASEPETMIPISHLCTPKTVVVLAGDQMQLGPSVCSREAEEYGLGKSYLERICECELYSNGDDNYVTTLVKNYHSHPKILHLPSTLFYDGELIASKDDTTIRVGDDFLPNKEFPMLFIGVHGFHERYGNNPSCFNRIEAIKVVEVVQKLIASGNVREDDIGIVAPHRQQVLKIKQALVRSRYMGKIKVGSLEQFQGEEKQIVIISIVQSSIIKHTEFDGVPWLGFLNNPRRFIVAVTRAKSLLVIIGNPHIIRKDQYWSKMLWYCVDNSSYIGCSLPRRRDR